MKYASNEKYDGQRAYITAPVVVNTEENGLCAGIIDNLWADDVFIVVPSEGPGATSLPFHPTQTVEEIEAMPVGCWTWPVRV